MTAGLFDFDGVGDGDRACGDPDIAGNISVLWEHQAAGAPNCDLAFGVFGSYGGQFQSGQSSRRRFVDGYATDHLFIGMHLRPTTGEGGRFDLYEGGIRHLQCSTEMGGSRFVVTNNAGTILAATPNSSLPGNIYHHVVVEVIIHDSAGEIRIYIDGDPTPLAEATGIDTRNGGTSGEIDNVVFQGLEYDGGSGTIWVDDIWMVDGNVVGAANLGPCRVTCRTPNSDDTAELTRSTGATNFGTVDERPFDSADYNETDVDGERDLYGITDDGVDLQIFGVRVIGQMSKSDASAAQMRLIIEDNGNQGNGTTVLLTPTPTVYGAVFPTRPAAAGEWDETSVDALLIGFQRVAV